MDTERGEMSEHHSQSEDETTISSILGAVFSVGKEEETTGSTNSSSTSHSLRCQFHLLGTHLWLEL